MDVVKKVVEYILKKIMNPIQYSRHIGVTIGKDCKLNGVPQWGSEPYLIVIGDHTEISFDVVFITHDGATWVFRNQEKYRKVVRFGEIIVGNNCFIGARSIILPNVHIGDNVIIGAGALVTKSIPDNEVWGGIPARLLMSTDCFADKCLKETPEYSVEELNSKRKSDEVKKIVLKEKERRK